MFALITHAPQSRMMSHNYYLIYENTGVGTVDCKPCYIDGFLIDRATKQNIVINTQTPPSGECIIFRPRSVSIILSLARRFLNIS